MSVQHYNIVSTKSEVMILPRTGRPKSEKTKELRIQIRADKETSDKLDLCCQKLCLTKSEIVRLGIEMVLETINKQ